MNEQELNKLNKEFYGFTMNEIDEDLGNYIIKYSNLKREKQDLIKYLEDKINSINKGIYRTDLTTSMVIKSIKDTYQEMLDKIKEGNYE